MTPGLAFIFGFTNCFCRSRFVAVAKPFLSLPHVVIDREVISRHRPLTKNRTVDSLECRRESACARDGQSAYAIQSKNAPWCGESQKAIRIYGSFSP